MPHKKKRQTDKPYDSTLNTTWKIEDQATRSPPKKRG